MAIVNLIKADFKGKLGQMVGAKWKDKSTVRSFTPPTNKNTPAQQEVRKGFANLTSFLALFTAQLESLSALDTKSMSVRNAIVKLNKEYIKDPELNPATLRISKGGLPSPSLLSAALDTTDDKLSLTFSVPPSPTISQKAKIVFVAVAPDDAWATVSTSPADTTSLTIPGIPSLIGDLHIYAYTLDYRGSSRVGSTSVYKKATKS